jgi:repressor LexA
VTTTADSAPITAQDRSQSRLEPVHAMSGGPGAGDRADEEPPS